MTSIESYDKGNSVKKQIFEWSEKLPVLQDETTDFQSINRPVVYLVPHTHYEAIWVFTKEDYFYINIELILKQVVDLIKGHKEYKFTIEQTFLLEHIECNYPKLFADITNFIKQGRIEIAGGQYLLCDVMLPHGEVLIREISEGKTYIKNKFD